MKFKILKQKYSICCLSLVCSVLFVPNLVYGQTERDSLLNIWNNVKLVDSTRANAYDTFIKTYYISKKPDSAYTAIKELQVFADEKNLRKQQVDAMLLEGYLYFNLGATKNALRLYKNALATYKQLNNKKGMATALSNIGSVYSTDFRYDESLAYYNSSLAIFENINDTLNISKVLIFIGNIYGNKYQLEKATTYFDKSLIYIIPTKDSRSEALVYSNMADNFTRKKEYQKAERYYYKSLEISSNIKDPNGERNTLFALSKCFLHQKKYDECILRAKESLTIAAQIGDNMYSVANYYSLSDVYKAKNNIELAFEYLEKATSLESQIKQHSANRALQKLEIEKIKMKDSLLQVEKTTQVALNHEKEINAKNLQRTRLILGWGGSLSALSIFGLIIYRNTKRKQHKAEKERQEQIEEKEKILKDLELTTIDAMIEGQEKERQRLASDLHDSVGATLAAAKMQFEYLIKHQNDAQASENLIKKTSTLLEDAYVEIRSMAHLKNAGVMAKNGLLPAVERLSKSASGINNLQLEVKSFGLDKRLENTLEIAIFRIVQELVTNIIKHAQASIGTIHLTNHEHNLNIMVEDNGIGFNPYNISTPKNGMGLNSINQRVAHLNGKITIDSRQNKDQRVGETGTTIIIDLPI